MPVIPPNLPPFQNGDYVFLPAPLVRITDAGTALLLAVLIAEKERAERDAGYPLADAEHPHDADRWRAALGWTSSYHSARFTAAKKLGVVTWRTVDGVRQVKVDVAAIQAKVGLNDAARVVPGG